MQKLLFKNSDIRHTENRNHSNNSEILLLQSYLWLKAKRILGKITAEIFCLNNALN